MMVLNMTGREKIAISGAIVIALVLLVSSFVVEPFLEKIRLQEKILHARKEVLIQMMALRAEYDNIKKDAQQIQSQISRRKKGFTLFAHMDRLAGETGIKEHITYMKPSTTISKDASYKISLVEVKLQAVVLKQVVGYLHKVENSPENVNIKRLSITKTGKQEGVVDVVLQVNTFEI
jgi:general secretion pathway protein M